MPLPLFTEQLESLVELAEQVAPLVAAPAAMGPVLHRVFVAHGACPAEQFVLAAPWAPWVEQLLPPLVPFWAEQVFVPVPPVPDVPQMLAPLVAALVEQ